MPPEYRASGIQCNLFSGFENADNYGMNSLADRLRAARKEKGLTQAELAQLAGLSGQTLIGNLETGYRKTSAELPRIAKALGVDVMWLIDGKGKKAPAELIEPERSLDADLLLRCCNAVDDWCSRPGRTKLPKREQIELVCYLYEFASAPELESVSDLQLLVVLDRWADLVRKNRTT